MPPTNDPIEVAQRYVVDADGCWRWTGSVSKHGYGKVRVSGRWWCAHRLAWVVHRGPIPEGMVIAHRCHVRSCINPDHLALDTTPELNRTIVAEGRNPVCEALRARETCARGHVLAGENLRLRGTTRLCRTCEREWQRARYMRQKEAR